MCSCNSLVSCYGTRCLSQPKTWKMRHQREIQRAQNNTVVITPLGLCIKFKELNSFTSMKPEKTAGRNAIADKPYGRCERYLLLKMQKGGGGLNLTMTFFVSNVGDVTHHELNKCPGTYTVCRLYHLRNAHFVIDNTPTHR